MTTVAAEPSEPGACQPAASRAGVEPLVTRLVPLWAALLAMSPHLGVLLGQTELYYDDHFRFSTPLASLVAESLRAGHLPLWNPWVMTGTPLVAERGGMVAHPGMLLALVMQPSHAVGTLMVLCLGVLAAGAAALLRELSVRWQVALGAGAALGLCGPALSHTSMAPYLATLAFFPAILLAFARLAHGRSGVLGGGLALGMALLGGDQPGALVSVGAAALLYRACGGRLRTGWARLAGMGVLGLAVGAAGWYPVVWGLPLSERGAGIVATEAGRWSFHPAEALGLVWPHPLGLPLPRFTFWPFRWLGQERLLVHSVWVGAFAATAAVLALGRRSDRRARALVLTALLLLIVATGAWTPLWVVLRPLFTFVRYPSKMVVHAAVLLALGGIVVVDGLLATPGKLGRLCAVVATLAVAGATAGPALQSWLAAKAGAPPEIAALAASDLRAGSLRLASLAAVGWIVSVLAARGRVPARWFYMTVSTLLLLDVFVATADLHWSRPVVSLERPSFLPEAAGRGLRVMRLEEVSRSRLALNDRAYTQEQLRNASLLSPLSNVSFRAAVLEAYGLYSADVARDMRALVGKSPLAVAETMAADLLLVSPEARAPWLVEAVDAGRLVPTHAARAGALAMRVTNPLPRSFLTMQASSGSREDVLAHLANGSHGVMVTQGRCLDRGDVLSIHASSADRSTPACPDVAAALVPAAPASPTGGDRADAPTLSPVQPETWRPGFVRYRIESPAPALLVEMDVFMKGWRAFVDGREQPAWQANLFGRAVLVPPGAHTVEWRFDPPSIIVALLLSCVALPAVLFVMMGRRLIRRRRASPSPTT